MATLIAFTADDPRPIAQAVEHLLTRHRFRRIPMPATAGYLLASAASMRGTGVVALIVAGHQAESVRAAGGTVVHLDTGAGPRIDPELIDVTIPADDPQLLRVSLDELAVTRTVAQALEPAA